MGTEGGEGREAEVLSCVQELQVGQGAGEVRRTWETTAKILRDIWLRKYANQELLKAVMEGID